MTKPVQIRYLYIREVDQEKIEMLIREIGGPRNLILREMIHAYFAEYHDYYVALGKAQAKARGMRERDLFTSLSEGGTPNAYQGAPPQIPTPPYDGFALSGTEKDDRYSIATLTLSRYNYVLLMLEQLVSQRTLPIVISILISHHINEQWETEYQPALMLEKFGVFG